VLRRIRQFLWGPDPYELIRSALPEVSTLMAQAFEAVGGTQVPGSGLDQAGLIDGAEDVEDWLVHGEPGLALEHLIYMVGAPPLAISESTYALIDEAGRSMKMDPAKWEDIRPMKRPSTS
jgi:hypothetical protein